MASSLSETVLAGCENLTEKARKGELATVINQKEMIHRILRFCESPRTGKQNILLIGHTGVGKTTIVEGVAQQLRNQELFQINTSDFLQLDPMRNEGYGNRLERIRKEIHRKEERVVFFFDEFGALCRKKAEGEKFAHSLNSHLSPTGIKCIAAMTQEEYDTMSKQEAFQSLLNRFQPIQVNDLQKEDIKKFLEATWSQEAPDIPTESSLWESLMARMKKEDGTWDLRAAKTWIHELVIAYQNAWNPLSSSSTLSKEQERDEWIRQGRHQQNVWNPTLERKNILQTIERLEREIDDLKKEEARNRERRNQLSSLRTILIQWKEVWQTTIHKLATSKEKKTLLEHRFLLHHLLLLPSLDLLLKRECSQEKPPLPLTVDKKFFDQHIPSLPKQP